MDCQALKSSLANSSFVHGRNANAVRVAAIMRHIHTLCSIITMANQIKMAAARMTPATRAIFVDSIPRLMRALAEA